MTRLSQEQIAMYAQSAGMANAGLMSAIAMAESSGETTKHNPIGLDDSYGLWQINMLGKMGPERRAKFGISSNTQLYDPAVNARAAARILSEQGLGAWSTYTDGSYKAYMPKPGANTSAQPAGWWSPYTDPLYKYLDPFGIVPGNPYNTSPGNPGAPYDGAANALGGLDTIAEGVVKGGKWLGSAKNWVRIAYIVGGTALVGIGLYIVASPVIGAAVAAAPSAQAIKGVVGKGKSEPSKAPAKKAAAAPAKKAAAPSAAPAKKAAAAPAKKAAPAKRAASTGESA